MVISGVSRIECKGVLNAASEASPKILLINYS